MRCLLVDDEDGIREGFAALLRLRGHEVRTAADRDHALALLAAQPFDVVLTDWRLPDGDAAPLIAAASCPVVAASGHPEEVAGGARLFAVLGKPILPARLLAILDAVAAANAPAVAPATIDALPLDVRQVVLRALALLGDDGAQVLDDGTFVTLSSPWRDDRLLPAFAELGGDLRILAPGGSSRLELRWYRDGRPDAAIAVVAPPSPWPDLPRLAVDFDGRDVDAAALLALAERAAALRAQGRCVLFLNVPADRLAAIEVSARQALLPMREPIGPRLPAVLQALWS